MRLIDADALKTSIEKKDRYNLGGEGRIVVCGMLDDAPTIEAEPVKHGQWDQLATFLICDKCKTTSKYATPYCFNCGAKMDLKDGETK